MTISREIPRAGGGGPVAAFVRFVVCGGGVTLLGSGALLLIGNRVPVALANAVVAVVTTVIATELHGRVTFRRGRASWRDHAGSGLTVLLSYLFTTGALLVFDTCHSGGAALLRQAVYLTASGAAGLARFLLLRCVVFARPRPARRPVRVVPVRVVREPPTRARLALVEPAGHAPTAKYPENAEAPRSAERGAPVELVEPVESMGPVPVRG